MNYETNKAQLSEEEMKQLMEALGEKKPKEYETNKAQLSEEEMKQLMEALGEEEKEK